MANARIKAIDQTSVHRITSSQVVVDLQTAVKELVENALDAGATVIDVRIKENGVKSVEVIDNGSGIAKDDYDTVALKHHTSKLSTFDDLTTVETFGFRGEALASLCALCESVVITTATASEAPMGTVLELDRSGRVVNKERRAARQRGTTVLLTGLFVPLPVRRKEFERHAKREYGKALTLLTAYALVPSTTEGGGVKLTVSHISESGKKSVQIQTDGSTNLKNSITALWGSKSMDNIVPMNLDIKVEPDSATLKRRGLAERQMKVNMSGLVSKFAVGCGRSSNDRQFFFVNKRPCNLTKVQKAINEVYKTFNATQSPFVVVDFTLPTDACDINVSPDKRTIFLHSEHNLIEAMKVALSNHFDGSRSMFMLQPSEAIPATNVPRRQSRRAAAAEPTSSSPEKCSSIPSLDPLPSTQPNTLALPPSDSIEEISVERQPTPAPERVKQSALDPSSSSLLDHISPKPVIEIEGSDEEPVIMPILPRKRPASRSPNGSPAPRSASSRAKKPIQMVLNTAGASWALTKENSGAGRKPWRKPSTEAAVVIRQTYGKKSASAMRSTLTQFRRGGDAAVESEEEAIAAVSEDESDKGKQEEAREHTRGHTVIERKSRATSRSSRSSMRIDSPPASPDSASEPLTEETSVEPVGLSGPRTASAKTNRSNSRKTSSRKPSQATGSSNPEPIEIPSSDGPEIIDLTSSISSEKGSHPAPVTEVLKDEEAIVLLMTFDVDTVTSRWKRASANMTKARSLMGKSAAQNTPTTLASDMVVDAVEESNAEKLLSRVIKKEDFDKMEILGQFNLGFILVRSRRSADKRSDDQAMDIDGDSEDVVKVEEMDDLFIVDQHAADEKYNFETLQLTTRIESQKLIRPRPLDFSASDKLVALENLQVLQSNGFEVELDAGAGSGDEEDSAENRGGQLVLVSQPVSKQTAFDMSDLSELLHLMQDTPSGTMVRCSKARAMFASRACRKSVMVGHPLSKAQMTSVVRHMSTMDQPWNCPHGRPTMRHLMRMAPRHPADTTARKVDWEKLK